MIAALVIGGVLLLAMTGVSWYGWITLPADARVPIHFGVGYNNFVSKRIGLIMHPAAGVLVYVIFALATHHPSKSSLPSSARLSCASCWPSRSARSRWPGPSLGRSDKAERTRVRGQGRFLAHGPGWSA
jgi:hypothetical protein